MDEAPEEFEYHSSTGEVFPASKITLSDDSPGVRLQTSKGPRDVALDAIPEKAYVLKKGDSPPLTDVERILRDSARDDYELAKENSVGVRSATIDQWQHWQELARSGKEMWLLNGDQKYRIANFDELEGAPAVTFERDGMGPHSQQVMAGLQDARVLAANDVDLNAPPRDEKPEVYEQRSSMDSMLEYGAEYSRIQDIRSFVSRFSSAVNGQVKGNVDSDGIWKDYPNRQYRPTVVSFSPVQNTSDWESFLLQRDKTFLKKDSVQMLGASNFEYKTEFVLPLTKKHGGDVKSHEVVAELFDSMLAEWEQKPDQLASDRSMLINQPPETLIKNVRTVRQDLMDQMNNLKDPLALMVVSVNPNVSQFSRNSIVIEFVPESKISYYRAGGSGTHLTGKRLLVLSRP